MRLFVSLRPPADVTAHLASVLAGRRTTDVEQWHLTLAFLGEVAQPAPLLPGLRHACSSSAPMTLRLAGGGLFRRQQVLWAGVDGDTAALHELAGRVAAACRAAGVHLEQHRPHITVARGAVDAQVLQDYRGPQWQAVAVELVLSRLGARAVHEVLERMPLRAP